VSSRSGIKRVSRSALALLAIAFVTATARLASASTYVVFLPLDSPLYDEFDTLNSLGYLDDYLDEIKPISRIEAARLTIEAQSHLADAANPDSIAREIVRDLRDQLREEIGWIQSNNENNPPTAMLDPIDRAELQYIYSRGPERFWRGSGGNILKADEGTPLLPNNDGIATAPASNEVARWGAWGGVGGFLSAYGEAAIAGPLGHQPPNTERVRPLGAETVADLGNWAFSFGQGEMWWGTGHFSALGQSDNADPIPGFRLQNVHPKLLPGFLRYLGQFRMQVFFGRLDAGRVPSQASATSPVVSFARPFIDGQILSFRTLPNFEWGITHTIMFGGHGNSNYGWTGFVGRATGFNTGSASTGNTNSQGGVFLRMRFPLLRDSILYVQTLGEDNLSAEVRPIGGIFPWLAVSYQGGYYLPRLTRDGRTDFRFEWKINEPNYQTHSDALYWVYSDRFMDDPLGPNASQIDFQVGRWFANLTKGSADLFFSDRAPKTAENHFVPTQFYGPPSSLHHERSVGIAFDLLTIPQIPRLRDDVLTFGRTHLAMEYSEHMNYGPPGAFRGVVSISIGIKPNWDGLSWTK
jgi:hypothetical protein